MPYVSQKDKKELAVEIKKVLKKYGMKRNIGVRNHMSLYVDVMSAPIDFGKGSHGDGYSPSQYLLDARTLQGNCLQISKKNFDAMKGTKYFNHDDAMTDYFHKLPLY